MTHVLLLSFLLQFLTQHIISYLYIFAVNGCERNLILRIRRYPDYYNTATTGSTIIERGAATKAVTTTSTTTTATQKIRSGNRVVRKVSFINLG